MIVEYLSDNLFLTEHEILKFSITSPHRYKVYEIPKRNSDKKRVIAHPAKDLKLIQRTLIELLSITLPIHESVFSYKKGLGIKDNAKMHANSRFLLKMDFKNFFPSITPELFFSAAEKSGITFDKIDKIILTGLLFWKSNTTDRLALSIGAPTSPLISNFVMYHFDKKLNDECSSKNITYSRYADDITFSTQKKNALFIIPNIVMTLLKETSIGVEINGDKTIFTSRAHNRHVTGVTLTNEGSLSIGRDRKRLISAMVHKSKFFELSYQEAAYLLGLISYATHIEPEFLDRIIKKYGLETLNKIKMRAVEG
jgi:RNA-directed DNA polymerase